MVGDFNYKEINWHNYTVNRGDQNIATLLDSVMDYFLFQLVQNPT